jgi:hypothetical protein
MNLFKPITLKWWQAGLFKLGIWALAIAVGAYWHTFFRAYVPELLVVGALCLWYIVLVWWQQ